MPGEVARKILLQDRKLDLTLEILFLEFNFGLTQGSLNFADARATTDLTGFFDLTKAPRPFQKIGARKPAEFFLHDKRKATDPDDQ